MSVVTGAAPVETCPSSSRRYATRYEPTRRDACLAWCESPPEPEPEAIEDDILAENEPRHHFALLLDISHTGASLALDRVPEAEKGVWLRLEGDSLTEWTEADVVGVVTTRRGPHLVRLAFRAPCPFETLKVAVCG